MLTPGLRPIPPALSLSKGARLRVLNSNSGFGFGLGFGFTDDKIPITRFPLLHLNRINQTEFNQGSGLYGDITARG